MNDRLYVNGRAKRRVTDPRMAQTRRTAVFPWWNAIVIPETPTSDPQSKCRKKHRAKKGARRGKSSAQVAHEAENARRHAEAVGRRAAKRAVEQPATPRCDKEAFQQHLIAHPTRAEVHLLGYLKTWGIPFEFQPIVQGYIPDFRILPGHLLIELDGGVHEDQRDYDQRRDGHLARRGWRVIRFANETLFTNPDVVRRAIAEAAIAA